MKAHSISRKAAQVAGVLLMAAMSVTAAAGAKDPREVTFDPVKPFARGDLGDARNSADAVQYIGCSVSPAYALCYAVNSAGVLHSCSTTDPDMLAAIRSIHGDSHMVFRWDSVSGLCTSFLVYNDSRYAPK
jgi:hypothetical protein